MPLPPCCRLSVPPLQQGIGQGGRKALFKHRSQPRRTAAPVPGAETRRHPVSTVCTSSRRASERVGHGAHVGEIQVLRCCNLHAVPPLNLRSDARRQCSFARITALRSRHPGADSQHLIGDPSPQSFPAKSSRPTNTSTFPAAPSMDDVEASCLLCRVFVRRCGYVQVLPGEMAKERIHRFAGRARQPGPHRGRPDHSPSSGGR